MALPRLKLAVLAATLSACTAPQEAPRATTGQALSQAMCPLRIDEARAWVNYMPGPGRQPRQLTVDIKFMEPTDSAIVLRSAASTRDTLVLELRLAPASAMPGRVGYREPVPDPLYKRISFFCRGGEIFSFTEIEKVY